MKLYGIQLGGDTVQWAAFAQRTRLLPGYSEPFAGTIYLRSPEEREEVRALLRTWLNEDVLTQQMSCDPEDDETITLLERT